MKLGENYSYKPPGASYTAPGPYILQGNEKMKENNFYTNFKNRYFGTWTSVSGLSESVLGRKFYVESESGVQNTYF